MFDQKLFSFFTFFAFCIVSDGINLRKSIQKSGIVKVSHLPVYFTSSKAFTSEDFLQNSGGPVKHFCEGCETVLVKNVSFRIHRSKRGLPNADDKEGQFTHHSYGHYGQQSSNYAHFGHDTRITGTLDRDGAAQQQTVHHQQVHTDGSPLQNTQNLPQTYYESLSHHRSSAPSVQINQGTAQPGNSFGFGAAKGFSLHNSYGSGYELHLPLGLRAGNTYRSGIHSQGQYGTNEFKPRIATNFARYPSGQEGFKMVEGQYPRSSTVPEMVRSSVPSSIPDYRPVIPPISGPGFLEGQEGFRIQYPRPPTEILDGLKATNIPGHQPDIPQTGGFHIPQLGRPDYPVHENRAGYVPIKTADVETVRLENSQSRAVHAVRPVAQPRQQSLPASYLTERRTEQDLSRARGHPTLTESSGYHEMRPGRGIPSRRLSDGQLIVPIDSYNTKEGWQITQSDNLRSRQTEDGRHITGYQSPNGQRYVPSHSQDVRQTRHVLPGNQSRTHDDSHAVTDHIASTGEQVRHEQVPDMYDINLRSRLPGIYSPVPETAGSQTNISQTVKASRQSTLSSEIPGSRILRQESPIDPERTMSRYPVSSIRSTSDTQRAQVPDLGVISAGRSEYPLSGYPEARSSDHPSPRGITLGSPIRDETGVLQPASGFPGQPGYDFSKEVRQRYEESTVRRPGYINGFVNNDSASSQTQVQSGFERTAAQASSAGRYSGFGSQTQVQGGFIGNGSFSAQAESGFTGGTIQSQVRGGKQGGLSGSSSTVERLGMAQSQVQISQPSGAASSTAQGKFTSGTTQVQAQGDRSGGSASAQSQSSGLSSSQVQINVAGQESHQHDEFQGTLSASVQGGFSSGQSQTQLQGGYNSGRTYAATAESNFDSTKNIHDIPQHQPRGVYSPHDRLPSDSLMEPESRPSLSIKPVDLTLPGHIQLIPSRSSLSHNTVQSEHYPRNFHRSDSFPGVLKLTVIPQPMTNYTKNHPMESRQTNTTGYQPRITGPSQRSHDIGRSEYQPEIPVSPEGHSTNSTSTQQAAYSPSPQHTLYAPGPQHSVYSPGPQHSVYSPGPRHPPYVSGPQQAVYSPSPQQSAYSPSPQHSPYAAGPHQAAYLPRSQQAAFSRSTQHAPYVPGSQQAAYSPGPQQAAYLPSPQHAPFEPGGSRTPANAHSGSQQAAYSPSPHHAPYAPGGSRTPAIAHGIKQSEHPQDVLTAGRNRYSPTRQLHYQPSLMHPSGPTPEKSSLGLPPSLSQTSEQFPSVYQPRFESGSAHLPDIQGHHPLMESTFGSQKPTDRSHSSVNVPITQPPLLTPPGHSADGRETPLHPGRFRDDQHALLDENSPLSPLTNDQLHVDNRHPSRSLQSPNTSPNNQSPGMVPRRSNGNNGRIIPVTTDRSTQSPGVMEPGRTDGVSCCEALRNLRRRCCDRSNGRQWGDLKSQCCSTAGVTQDFDSAGAFDKNGNGEPCKVVKAICYIVYKRSGKARICKPTETTSCRSG